MLLVSVVSVVVWWYARRVASTAVRHVRRPVRRALVYWRRMPMWPLVVSLPLSFLNVATRTAILPVLALTLPSPPELGPMFLGSFALLYSQLILPTPSGAGAVELGFLGGAAVTWANAQVGSCSPGASTPTGSGCCSASVSRRTPTAGRPSAG